MLRGGGLKQRAVLAVAVVLLLALGLNTAILTSVAASKYKRAVLSRVSSEAASLKAELEKALALGIPLSYMEDLNGKLQALLQKDPSLAYAAVLDAEAQVLFRTEGAPEGRLSVPKDGLRELEEALEVWHPLLDAEGKVAGHVALALKAQVLRGGVYSLIKWAVVVGALGFVVFLAVVYAAVARFVVSPVAAIQAVAREIATGNLARRVRAEGTDEIAHLGRSINEMAEALKEMLSRVQDIGASTSGVVKQVNESSTQVLGVSDAQRKALGEIAQAVQALNALTASIGQSTVELLKSAEDTSTALSQMTASISTVAEGAEYFDRLAQEAAESIQEMIASVKDVASSLESLSASAEDTASALLQVNATIKEIQQSAGESVRLAERVSTQATQQGMSAADAALQGMKLIRDNMQALTASIGRLGRHSDQIGDIVTVISDVADQTSLLALNAAILAAQAGQHGTGFAVVADEIKALAERTTASTKEIAEIISTVQGETKRCVELADEAMKAVQQGSKLFAETNTALRSIRESSELSTEMARTIQRATQEEAGVIKQITEAISGMTERVKHISHITAGQSRESSTVLQATEKIREGARQVRQATSEQLQGSRQLASMAENVHGQAEQISRLIEQQRQQSAQISSAVGQVQRTAQELLGAANMMRQAVEYLQEDVQRLLSEVKKFSV
jgi:methyl-accepting chemotaxis protein